MYIILKSTWYKITQAGYEASQRLKEHYVRRFGKPLSKRVRLLFTTRAGRPFAKRPGDE